MQINICFSCDNNYVQHLGVTIASILKNSGVDDDYNFYIMDGGISEKNKLKLQKLKTIRDFSINYTEINNNDFKACPMTNYVNYITLPTYYRFKIPSFFKDVDKILYMDCDMVVLGDIAQIYKTDINDYYVAAVPEVYNNHHKERLEFDKDEYYFNAGLLLINNKKWREDNIEQKLFDYALNPKHKIVYQDQDILNEVLKEHIFYLDLKWNLQHDAIFYKDSYIYHEKQRIKAVENPEIIHFTHRLKPWFIECQNPYQKAYLKYLKITPWKSRFYKMKFKKFKLEFSKKLDFNYQNIFSIKNSKDKKHKIITAVGVKIKIKRKPDIRDVLVKIESIKSTQAQKYSNHEKKYKVLLEQNQSMNNLIYEQNEKITESISKMIFDLKQQLSNQNQGKFIIDNIKQRENEIYKSVTNYCATLLLSYNLHKEVFTKYRGINKNKKIVLIATGPMLEQFEPMKNVLYCGVNTAYKYDRVKFDYLFLQDYAGRTPSYIEDFVKYPAKKFIGFLPDYIEPNSVIPVKYSNFEDVERYYAFHPKEKSNFTYDISSLPFADSYSVVFPAMQFLLWTNPKRIYLVGCDCSTSGYFNSSSDNILLTDEVIKGWGKMKDFAKIYYPNTEIISINPVGLKGMFKDIYTQEFLKGNLSIV